MVMSKAIVAFKQISEQFIKNIDLPICVNCLFYEKINKQAVCKKFGEKNVITGNITYVNVINCRTDINACGKKGLYFSNARKF